jgi:enoyl-CoA hydratase/carnithine racemase
MTVDTAAIDEPSVLVSRIELVAGRTAGLLTLNRPAELNALDADVFRALDAGLTELEADDGVACVFLTGAGRAFSAGGDLKSYVELQRDPVAFPAVMALAHGVFRRMRHLPKPVISLINGVCAAGGLELLLSSDCAYAAQSARIGDGHLRYGQMGGGGSLALLPRLIGPARARELIFSARLLTADDALAWGLINRVVPDADLLDAAVAFGCEIAAVSPLAIANAKHVLTHGWEQGTGVDMALEIEAERTAFYCLTSSDAREGLAAFADKREPRFSGR